MCGVWEGCECSTIYIKLPIQLLKSENIDLQGSVVSCGSFAFAEKGARCGIDRGAFSVVQNMNFYQISVTIKLQHNQ